jgi:hypothetical protein
MAKALAQRPQLRVSVRGGYDPRSETQALARARADAVRAALVEHGVEGSRVGLEAPLAAQGERGPPTVLSLETGLSGPRARSDQPADGGILSKVRRRLAAEGFDAGSPAAAWDSGAERALLRFQRSSGLPASGELDIRTLTALGVIGGNSSASAGR